jgi:hypothetical protein
MMQGMQIKNRREQKVEDNTYKRKKREKRERSNLHNLTEMKARIHCGVNIPPDQNQVEHK